MKLGVWAMNPGFDDITLAAGMGFTRLDVMVHDMAKERSPQRFKLKWGCDEYRNIVAKATMAGIKEVHFTAWAMPHIAYMRELGDTLQQLCIDTHAHGIVLDCEEPLTKAIKPDYGRSADAYYEAVMGCRTAVTGIGYCDLDKLRPLAERADYNIPQAYICAPRPDAKSKPLRHASVPAVLKHWAKFGRPIHAGLAAYRQAGIPGHTTRSAMNASLDAVRGCIGVSWWSLRQIKGNTLIRNTMFDILSKENAKEQTA